MPHAAVLLSAALLAAAPAGGPRPQDPGEKAAADGEPAAAAIRLMSFNLRYGTAADGEDSWPARRGFVEDTIRRHAPQVVGLQEALDFQLDWLAERFPRYATLGAGRDADGGGEHTALLVDTARFAILDCGTFWLSETPEKAGSRGWDAALPRTCTWARLRDRELGRELHVANLHLDHEGERARIEAARLVAARVADSRLPDIVLGDLNAPEGQEPLRLLLEAGLRDTFRVTAPDERFAGTFNGFRTANGAGPKIDFVLVDAQFEVRAASIDRRVYDGRRASDHDAVVAEVLLRPAGTPPDDSAARPQKDGGR